MCDHYALYTVRMEDFTVLILFVQSTLCMSLVIALCLQETVRKKYGSRGTHCSECTAKSMNRKKNIKFSKKINNDSIKNTGEVINDPDYI